eukprot:scaffold5_cov331-Pavlova_lutheri.AAC.34
MEGGKHPTYDSLRRRRSRPSNLHSFSKEDFCGHVLPFRDALSEWRKRKEADEWAKAKAKKDAEAQAMAKATDGKGTTAESPRTPRAGTKVHGDSNGPKAPHPLQDPSYTMVARKEDGAEEDEEEVESLSRRTGIGRLEILKFSILSVSIAMGVMAIIMYLTPLDVEVRNADLEAILLISAAVIGGYWWVVPVLVVLELFFQSTVIFSPSSLIVYFSISLHSLVRQFLYVWLIFGLWAGLFTETTLYATLNRVLGCVLVFVGARILNRIFIKWFSLSFHQRTYFKKIYKAIQNEFLLLNLQAGQSKTEKMLDKSLINPLSPMLCMKRTNSTIQDRSTLAEIYKISEADLFNSPFYVQKAAKHIRKSKLPILTAHQKDGEPEVIEMESRQQAYQLAKRVFRKLRSQKQAQSLTSDDLQQLLSARDAAVVLDWDKKTEYEEIRLSSLIEAFGTIYDERRSLALTLRDSNTVLGKVSVFTGAILGIFVVVIWLLMFEIDVMEMWIAIGSAILGLSFIFGSSIQMIFETSLFIFFVHPFDVEDDIQINGEQYTVESIGLHTTQLCHADGRKFFVRMSSLACSDLVNLSRSECRWEVYYFLVDAGTQSYVFQKLTERVQDVVDSDKDDYQAFSVSFASVDHPLKLSLKLAVGFNHSGADLGRMNWDRTRILAAVREVLTLHGVRYTMGVQPLSGLDRLVPSLPRDVDSNESLLDPQDL